MRKSRVTLSDVAAKSGVSATTASFVLGGTTARHRISEDTRRRILDAAQQLDYVPNRLVHGMQRGTTQILSFFDGFRVRHSNDLYRDRLTTALEKAAGRHGYDVLINCDFTRSPLEMYRFLNGGIVDGVLFFGATPDDPLLPYLRHSRLPVVLLGAEDAEGMLSSVRDDVWMGMQRIADMLAALGHRRIVIPAEAQEDNWDAGERCALLRGLLREKGITPLTCIVPPDSDGAEATLDYVRTFGDGPEKPTAVFCWRDYRAYALLEQCERRAVRVPEEFSIVGYDGLPWPTATSHRAASIHVDFDLLTETAIQLLLARIHHSDQEVIQHRLAVTLDNGTTLAPPSCA